jgi:hypothetical protein
MPGLHRAASRRQASPRERGPGSEIVGCSPTEDCPLNRNLHLAASEELARAETQDSSDRLR